MLTRRRKRAILRSGEMFQGSSTVKSRMFSLVIPPPARFNYSPSELSVGLQVWPGAGRPLHPITQFDLLTFHLFSNHDMTFRVCQVRAIPAHGSSRAPAPPLGPPRRGGQAPRYINHSDIVIAAALPQLSMQICGQISLIYSVSLRPPLHHHPITPLLSLTFAPIPMVTASYWGIVLLASRVGRSLGFKLRISRKAFQNLI